jgi:hypothetical protein
MKNLKIIIDAEPTSLQFINVIELINNFSSIHEDTTVHEIKDPVTNKIVYRVLCSRLKSSIELNTTIYRFKVIRCYALS